MKKITKFLTIIFCAGICTSWNFKPVECARILAIAPINARSHWNLMQGVLRALTNHGHQVTCFTAIPDGNRENYTEINLSKELPSLVRLDIDVVQKILTQYTDLITFVHDYSRENCVTIYKNNVIQQIMADTKSKFDIIFVEFMASECVSYLSSKLNIPLVYITPPPIISYAEHLFLGEFVNPAYVSHTLIDHSIPRTFYQRFVNTMLLIYTSCLLQLKSFVSSKMDQQPFDLIKPVKPSIVFSNAHYITDAPRPIPPNVIQIGGIHLSPPKKIPDDILEFIENSPNGVIVFTLGSVVAIASLPKHIQETIIELLGQVPQRVLLKYEDNITNIPKNIMTKKWFPQRDILLHPNVKLFISHGGISGMYEAVDAGIPVLGFPVFYDQLRNLENLVDAGMAISMNLESILKDNFSKAISKLLNNEKYLKNAKIASKRFKDRPMSLEQTVDYWTRYVIRHKGAPHLKSYAFNLTWYQYLLLDVISVFLVLVLLFVFITYIVFNLLYKYCYVKFSSKNKTKSE